MTDRYVYTPYGVEAPLNTSGNPFRYTGRRHDPESELCYYRARYYWPEIGRFLETDPIGNADQMNLYAYVANNPLNATDPSGMERVTVERDIVRTGSRIPRTHSVTVETDLEQSQVESMFEEMPDSFFIAHDGADFGRKDQGPVRRVTATGRTDNGTENDLQQREQIRIAAQISRSIQPISEEFDMQYRGTFYYDLRSPTRYGQKDGFRLMFGPRAVSAGLGQTIATTTHERFHFRWGSAPSPHQSVYNAVYDLVTPLGINAHYRCMDPEGVGCR